jgi:translation initiation factor 1
MDSNSRLVYTTEKGRMCPSCGQHVAHCGCKAGPSKSTGPAPGDGTICIGRETKGRKGKGVTIIDGLPGDAGELQALAAQLKRHCGSGGSIKGGRIFIQGDHRANLQAELTRKGYRVKLAGG